MLHFFHRHHHRSFMPLFLAGLTLALVVFMAFVLPGEDREEVADVIAPTEEEYRERADEVMASFLSDFPDEPNDTARLLLVDATLEALLSLRVPATMKDLHYQLAVALVLIQEGLRGDEEKLNEGWQRLMKATAENS